jgi:hypothetical protein
MTKEQYKRAVEINDRIRELNEVKTIIKDKTEHRLSYLRKDITSDWSPISSYVMKRIGNILNKHDVMIRQEIDQEIFNLLREFNNL